MNKIPQNILNALKITFDLIKDQKISWVLTGSTSLAIQGVKLEVNDIDIITDEKGAWEIDRLLDEFRIQPPNLSKTEKYRSYFGIYKISDVQLEVMGQFQYRLKNNSWSDPYEINQIIYKQFEGMNLPLLSLKQELKEYQNLKRFDKVQKIKEAMYMKIDIRSPKTEKEFTDYYQLRWEILRKPWNEPRGSEKDNIEFESSHIAAFYGDSLIGCGRLHFKSRDEAKVRFMAVNDEYQNQGIGGMILDKLEEIARGKGVKYIILDARETAVDFYKKHDYKTIETGHVLFANIPHWKMKKDIVKES